MNSSAVRNIWIHSDVNDLQLVTNILKKLDNNGFSIKISHSSKFNYNPQDINIVYLTKDNSELFNQILFEKDHIHKHTLYVVNEFNAHIGINLSKQGIENIFALPYEKEKFINHLNNKFKDHNLERKSRFSFLDHREYVFNSIMGSSKEALKMLESAKKVSNTKTNILILGETGTGKGLLARAIHDYGNPNDEPFVDVVCTAIPENLLESELFGFEKGAFTGAKKDKPGLFEVANGGTIFLDEIGDLSLKIQAKLLRVVEKKIIRRVGGIKDIPVDVRIISATNRDLEELVKLKLFRSDLYYRLNIVTLKIPPLRERGDDILHLTEHFVIDFSKKMNIPIHHIERDLLQFLINYPWPGNIRELRNAIERAVVLSEDNILKLKFFKSALEKSHSSELALYNFVPSDVIRMDLKYNATNLKTVTKLYAKNVLEKFKGNKSKTAKVLGVTRPTLDKLLN